jgi:putative heme-binding domain-containing protein
VVGFQPATAVPSWIWLDAEPRRRQTVYFRKEFEIKGTSISAARLYATCDNEMTLYINGREVLSHGTWQEPMFKDVLEYFVNDKNQAGEGRHVVAVRAKNDDSAAGLLVRLVFDSPSRQPFAVVSDATWRASENSDWKTAGFEDKGWSPAVVVGKLGDKPWQEVTEATLASSAKLRDPAATMPDQLKVAPDFRVELLYSVPKEKQGSWVCLCVDSKGRLIASDQLGGLYQITPPALNEPAAQTKVEPLPVRLGEAQGLLWAFDSLYVVVNSGRLQSGLYRVQDSDGDGKLDKVTLLRKLEGGGAEHGPHAVLPAPDGKSLVVVCGNQTALTRFDRTRVPVVWGEDHLLPRMPDGRGFMAGVLGPGGAIYQTDPDGKHWELLCVGFRNPYDAAFNRHGDLFTYDADMEWDVNTPWYRPTRICLAASGAEFGWRNGTGKWPAYYPDSLPSVLDIGPGSPTGVTFAYESKFPAKYREALFICDWSYGKMYAVHLMPEGAGYRGQAEEFLSGSPLPLTDVVVNPKDGAMYFAIGGRLTKSGLYRVTYVGKESAAPAKDQNDRGAELRALRRKLESFHGRHQEDAVEFCWPYLGHADRYLRFAARVALEHQDVKSWQDRALTETEPQTALTALLALVRVTSSDPFHRPKDAPPADKALQNRIFEALQRFDWGKLDEKQRLDMLRVYAVACNRMDRPSESARQRIIAHLDTHYPAGQRAVNAELCQLLVYLEAPDVASRTMELLAKAPTQEEQLDYVKALRVLKTGWTPALRSQYFSWFVRAQHYKGGNSFAGFVNNIKKEAVAALTDTEKAELTPILEAAARTSKPVAPAPPRPFVRAWKVDDLAPLVEKGLAHRDRERGRMLFGEAKCFACHSFDNEGGALGPDLTGVAGRFSARDLLESIIEPNKVISDQYSAVTIGTIDGKLITGRIVNLSGDSYSVMTDLLQPNDVVRVDRRRVEFTETSKVSMMPSGTLDTLNEDEVLDLLAYLLSHGGTKEKRIDR